MENQLVIIGASGHGKVVVDIAKRMEKYEKIAFLDDADNLTECMGYKVVGKSSEYKKFMKTSAFFVAIGNAKIRKKIMETLLSEGGKIDTLIHPDAVMAEGVYVGKGSVVMAGVVINADVKIGDGCIINTCSSIDHDSIISDYVHVAVGAHIAGSVTVGRESWIGAGVVVSNNIEIVHNCIVGVGAAVVSDLKESGTYVGVPAKRIIEERVNRRNKVVE